MGWFDLQSRPRRFAAAGRLMEKDTMVDAGGWLVEAFAQVGLLAGWQQQAGSRLAGWPEGRDTCPLAGWLADWTGCRDLAERQ